MQGLQRLPRPGGDPRHRFPPDNRPPPGEWQGPPPFPPRAPVAPPAAEAPQAPVGSVDDAQPALPMTEDAMPQEVAAAVPAETIAMADLGDDLGHPREAAGEPEAQVGLSVLVRDGANAEPAAADAALAAAGMSFRGPQSISGRGGAAGNAPVAGNQFGQGTSGSSLTPAIGGWNHVSPRGAGKASYGLARTH